MGEYYSNNDWRDYKVLKHYGIKGMKWGKRKKYKYEAGTVGTVNHPEWKSIYLRKNSTNDDYGHKIGINYSNIGNKKEVSFYNTKNDKYADSYWKNPSKYEKKNKKVLGGVISRSYAEDGVNYSVNLSLAKKKVSKIASNSKSKAKSFIKSISNKKIRRKSRR